MTVERSDNIRTLTGVVSALCLTVLVPLNTWALLRLVDHGERIVAVESFIGNQAIVKAHTKHLDDLEDRVRKLEGER